MSVGYGIDVNLPLERRDDDALSDAESRVRDLGLAGAWVTALGSFEQEPHRHADALGTVRHSPKLSVIHVLVPPSGRAGAVARFHELASEADCRIARVCPGSHGYPLADWVLSPFPELCERHQFSLLVDFDGQPIPWVEVVSFARAFPAVPMILVGWSIGQDWVTGAALDSAPNLLLELSGRAPAVALDQLVSVYGHHRFVFGSGGSPHAARQVMDSLQETTLDAAAVTAIAEGNARLLGAGTYAEQYL